MTDKLEKEINKGYVKLENKMKITEDNDESYNPLAWGILFFTMWLTLVTIHGTGKTTTWIPMALLILSILLMLSIFLKILFLKIFKNDVTTKIFKFISTMIIPLVFEITISGIYHRLDSRCFYTYRTQLDNCYNNWIFLDNNLCNSWSVSH